MPRKTKKTKRSSRLRLFIQFIKVNIAGNILFLTTYIGFPVFHEVLGWERITSLVVASLIGNVIFFILDKEWVFNTSSNSRKTRREVMRFIIFMTLNFFINIAIVEGLARLFDITPYVGQFVAAGFFTVWNFIGLKFWVFQENHRHAISVKRVAKKLNG